MRSQLNILQLVYPPVSNQEAEWLKDDAEVRAELRGSNLYLIGQRAEAFFKWTTNNPKEPLQFEFHVGDEMDVGAIDTESVANLGGIDWTKCQVEIELSNKLIRCWESDKQSGARGDVLGWFTTEKLLFDRWRGHPSILGLDEYRKFTKYRLHYVGISKRSDSLTRLVVRPHDKRIRVLSNEATFEETSRVTDEIVLMFFRVNPLRITTMDTDADIDEMVDGPNLGHIESIADAEKALVHIMQSDYNTVQFQHYPAGKDGLCNFGLDRYGYVIGEDIELETDSETILGKLWDDEHLPQQIDHICVEGDAVTLHKGPPIDAT